MRLINIAAILLVCGVFVTCSSHKGRSKGGKKHLSTTTTTTTSTTPSPDEMDLIKWSSRQKTPKDPSSLGTSKKENPLKRPPKKKDWARRHRRKHWALLEMAEADRLLHSHLVPEAAPFRVEETTESLQCCPMLVETVQPRGGVNLAGHLVELYHDAETTQKMYELSCRPDVLNKPCRFIEKNLRPLSRCTQKYTYTYALVSDHTSTTDWRLDYVRLRSGCACEIHPPGSILDDESMTNVTGFPVR